MSGRFVASIELILFHVTAVKCHGGVNGKNFGARVPYASANAILRLRIFAALKVGRRMGGWCAALLVAEAWRLSWGVVTYVFCGRGCVAVLIYGGNVCIIISVVASLFAGICSSVDSCVIRP